MARSGTSFHALRRPGFAIFIVTGFVSNIGFTIQTVAQGILVYRLTGSAPWLGAVGAAATLPYLVFTPLGGVYADRWNRQRAMFILQAIMMLCAAALGVLIQLDRIAPWHILVATLVSAAATGLYYPASQAIVKDLVGAESLVSGVSLMIGQFQVSRALGPFCAAWLLGHTSISTCFYANSASFLPFIAVLARLKLPALAGGAAPPMLESLRAGWRVAVDDRSIRTVLVFSGLVGLFVVPLLTLAPQLADRVYQVGDVGLADLYAVAGAGAVLGAFSTGALSARFRWRSLLIAAVVVGVASVGGVGLSDSPALGAALLAANSFARVLAWTVASATVQRLAPDLFRGRLISFNFLSFNLAVGVGNLVLGGIAGIAGSQLALLGAAGLALVIAIATLITARGQRGALADR